MKKKRKKEIAAIFVFVAAMIVFAGCGKNTQETEEEEKNTLTILVREKSTMEEAIREKFPDIHFEFSYYDGYNASSDLHMKMKHHDVTDIYTGSLQLEAKDAQENLMDLSGYEFCDNYEPSLLESYDVNGAIYQLPGSMTIRCILYNKEMFAQHGWKEPRTFGELTALCRQIRAETDDITPIVFGGAGVGYYFTTMTTYAQTEFLYKPEGIAWEKAYLEGNASAKEGFASGIQMMQELIDAKAFDCNKNLDYWDLGILKNRMNTEEAAMQFIWGGQHEVFDLIESKKDTYGVMPFYNYRGDAFLGTSVSYNIGVSKRLEQPENEEKLKNALRVMEYFSTEEGLKHMTLLSGSVIYPLKNAKNEQTISMFRELWNENIDGIKAPMLYTGYEDVLTQAAEYIIEAIEGKHDLSGLTDLIDEIHQATINGDTDNKKAYVGTFSENFTHQETVQMIAEMMHSRKDSDITLVSDGERVGKVKNRMGAHSRFYQGALGYDWVTVFMPGSNPLENTMMQMKLTGRQIQKLLENGKQVAEFEGEKDARAVEFPENAIDTSRYEYYWAGMDVTWNAGKVVSMRLEDGRNVEPEQTYTVSFAIGDYMDTTEQAGNPVALDYSVYDIFCEYMQNHDTVSPIKVQRCQ